MRFILLYFWKLNILFYLFAPTCSMGLRWVTWVRRTQREHADKRGQGVCDDVAQTEMGADSVVQRAGVGTLYCLAMFCLWFSSTCLNLVSRPRSWTSIFSTYCRSLWVRWSSTWMDWVMFWTWGGRRTRLDGALRHVSASNGLIRVMSIMWGGGEGVGGGWKSAADFQYAVLARLSFFQWITQLWLQAS